MKTTCPSSPLSRNIRRPGILAWLRLARVFHKVERVASSHVLAHGISLGQFDVLAHVGAEEGITQQELADALLVTKGNVCQLLGRMETAGYIERRQDGRANRLYLTEKGRALWEAIVPEHEAEIAGLFSGLTPEEQVQLLGLLRKLDRSIS